MRHRHAYQCAAVALVLLAASARNDAHAQAWVGDKGTLDLNFDYNFGTSSKVLSDGDGMDFTNSGTTSHQLTLGGEFVPIPKLAVSLAVPLMLLKYKGDPAFAHGEYDDGSTHTTLTDVRVGARYQLLEEPLAVSPHLAFSIPAADYEVIGNTVAGRHLKALHLGLGIGRLIGDATYIHLLYEFSLVEKFDENPMTAKHGQNRSDSAFTVGRKVLKQRLDIHLDLNLRETHGGIKFSEFPGEVDDAMLTTEELAFHDAILDEDIILVGGGVGYQISNSLSASLGARFFVAGANTLNSTVIALGLAWSPL